MNVFGQRRSRSLTFIIINVAVFFFVYLMPGLLRYLAIYPAGLLQGYLWTPLTYMFTHIDFTHILFNMIFLIFTAPAVESRIGGREFTAYYLISGTLAGLFSVFAYRAAGVDVPIIGASGALYAVLLAFAAYFPRATFMVFFVIPMRAPYVLALFAGIDLLTHLRGGGGGGVARLTHLSGLAFGYLYFLIRLRINPIRAMRDGR